MSPNRQYQRQNAGSAASTLQGLLLDPRLVQLLQQPPPADFKSLNEQQQHLLGCCCCALNRLEDFLPESVGSAAAVQQLTIALRHEAAHSAAVLMAWAQQRPELLQPETFHTTTQSGIPRISVTAVWVMSCRVLDKLVLAVYSVSSSSAAALAAEMTRQLGRSGGLHMQLSQHFAKVKALYMLHFTLITFLLGLCVS
jgi:hypothetical protein